MKIIQVQKKIPVFPEFDQHVIYQQAVIPGAYLLEWLLQQTKVANPYQRMFLSNVSFGRMLPVTTGSDAIDCTIEVNEENTAWNVLTHQLAGASQIRRKVSHCSFHMCTSPPEQDRLNPPCEVASNDLVERDPYQEITFGPFFKNIIGKVAINGDQAQATVQLPCSDDNDAHFLLLDGAFQVACILGLHKYQLFTYPVSMNLLSYFPVDSFLDEFSIIVKFVKVVKQRFYYLIDIYDAKQKPHQFIRDLCMQYIV